MTNAELIKALQCKSNDINDCTLCAYHNACYGGTLEEIAADALEAAEKRIAELEKQHGIQLVRNVMLTAKIPKEGEWIHGRELGKEWIYDQWVAYFEDWRCSNCGVVFEQENKPKYRYCPNCGTRMKGEQNEQTRSNTPS